MPSGLQDFYSPSYEVSMTQSYFGGWLLHTSHNLKPFSSTDRKEKSIKVMQFLCGIDFSYLNLNYCSMPSSSREERGGERDH